LGVDDWAQRRGRTYGTILVNLETHEVIDVLPDRTAETLTTWLHQHPEVEIISRDRGGAYADGARQGAPQAVQVADRFHLLKNVTDSFERFLARNHARLRQAAQALVPSITVEEAMVEGGDKQRAPVVRSKLTRKEQEHQERRAAKLARYAEVLALRGQGHSLRAIADLTGLDRRTVRRYVQAEGFPENQPRARRTTQITRFVPYLQERWAAGCHNAKQLWHEIRRQGFSGGYTTLTDYLRAWRGTPARRGCPRQRGSDPRPASSPCTYTARQTLWLLLRPVDDLTAEEQAYLTHLYHACPHVALAQALVQDFAAVLREHDIDGLYTWVHSAGACPIRALSAVARGMWLDRQAIEAAVATAWSQGQTEGQVNRLKVIKRGMYGRAKFDLLRQRVLHAA
jgi:transposase